MLTDNKHSSGMLLYSKRTKDDTAHINAEKILKKKNGIDEFSNVTGSSNAIGRVPNEYAKLVEIDQI